MANRPARSKDVTKLEFLLLPAPLIVAVKMMFCMFVDGCRLGSSLTGKFFFWKAALLLERSGRFCGSWSLVNLNLNLISLFSSSVKIRR